MEEWGGVPATDTLGQIIRIICVLGYLKIPTPLYPVTPNIPIGILPCHPKYPFGRHYPVLSGDARMKL